MDSIAPTLTWIARTLVLCAIWSLASLRAVNLSANEGNRNGATKWTAATVEAELKQFELVLKGFGLQDPFRRMRQLIRIKTDWSSADTQAMWQSRIAYWRLLLLDEQGPSWGEWLSLDDPALEQHRINLAAGGAPAREAWAAHVRSKPSFHEHLRDSGVRMLLFETDSWSVYTPDGTFLPNRSEALLEGRIHWLDVAPVQRDTSRDYNWLIQHPQEHNFFYGHQESWHFLYLALGQFHLPDPKWVREFQNEVLMHIAMCPELPVGRETARPGEAPNASWSDFSRVATRLRFLVPTYLVMKDSPAMSPRFHAIVSRMIWAHAAHIDRLGKGAYTWNYLCTTGLAQYLAAAPFPEFKENQTWLDHLWPLLEAGYRREILADGCHFHRSLSYHLTFVQRALSIFALATTLGRLDEVPESFRTLGARTVDAFVATSTPIRSTPGINDDWTIANDYSETLRVAADIFGRDDWQYLASDAREGTPPATTSWRLPAAGLVTMRSDWSPKARWLFFNVSPDGGHHHDDTLSIQIWAGGRRLLGEPGTGHYYQGERALYGRSWWHSCPTLGPANLPKGLSPSILHWETSDDLEYGVGEIRLPLKDLKSDQSAPGFRRHVFFLDRRCWVLWDEFTDLPEGVSVWENFHFPTEHLEVDDDGRLARTSWPDGANLLMVVGQANWKLQQETTKFWMKYGGKPDASQTLHYKADADLAARGFAALFVPFEGQTQPADTSLERIEWLDDGRVRLIFIVRGERRMLTTRVLNKN